MGLMNLANEILISIEREERKNKRKKKDGKGEGRRESILLKAVFPSGSRI